MKRKLQLDQIAEGLSSLGFMDLLCTFTDKMEALFVGGCTLPTNEDLLNLVKIQPSSGSEITHSYLQKYILDLDQDGK